MASTMDLMVPSVPTPTVSPVVSSKVNLHYLRTCVILENKDKSSVILWTSPKEQDGALQFRKFKGDPNDHGISLNRELQTPIIGTLGVFKILSGWFTVVMTENVLLGSIGEHSIYRGNKYQLFPIPGQIPISEEEKKIQTQFLTNFLAMLDTCGFYYSPTYDITHSRQKQSTIDLKVPLWNRLNDRFYWNKHFMKPFIDNEVNDWILPVMDGFIEINPSTARVGPYVFVLISRRECYRTGARFHTRGADCLGHVANFAETEQIIIMNGNVSSWVQTRGSIPLIWFQPRSINPSKAKPTVDYSPFSRNAFLNHIEEQTKIYGRHTLVSLIDQKGNEAEVGEAFETQMRLLEREDVKYLAFDFHEECKNNNYARLDVLLEQVKNDILGNQYFLQDSNGNVLVEQKGNIRTNCIDCLDRTNVVQSQFGRFILKEQLANLGIIAKGEEYNRNFQGMLNNVWTNNADALSKRYTGVGALKTDFTRTGKRSAKGAVADGVKSVTRLYHSTFNDDYKQDSTEFLLGKFTFLRPIRFKKPNENSFQFKTLKKTTWDAKGKNCILELNYQSGILLIFYPETAICKTFSVVSDLFQISKYSRHYCGLELLFSSAVTKKFIFASPTEREKFYLHVECLRNRSKIPSVPSIQFDSNQPIQEATVPSPHVPLKVFVGTVNHSSTIYNEPPSLEGFIPRDRDLYVIGAQNCYYRVPQGYYFQSGAHWAFTIQEYLGSEFKLVKLVSLSNRLITVVLVRSCYLYEISNMELSYTVLAPPRVEPTSSSSNSKKGFGGFLRSITSEVKKGFTTPESSSNYSEADYMGIALAFTFFETSLCFINSSRCYLPFRLLDFDIANDFHHVFLFGDVNNVHLNAEYWIPLTENEQFGSVFWRMLLDSKLDGILSSREAEATSPIPVSVCFSLKATRYVVESIDRKATITLHDISVSNLEVGDRTMRLFDPYAIMHSSCAIRHARTSAKQKTTSALWDDILRIPTIPTSLEYLKSQHIVVCVYDQEEGYLIGKGVIRIESGVSQPDQPFEFVVRLSVLDETRGVLRGKFYISFEELTPRDDVAVPSKQVQDSSNIPPQTDNSLPNLLD